MSTLADKMGLPKGLLDAVNGVLSEELSDKQKKIDMNKNGKIDGEDLSALRNKKKPQGADFAAQRRKERLASNGNMDEDQDLEEGGEQYKVKSIGYDPKRGDYFVHPTTGEKVYKSGVSKGDHVNPKTGEVKKKVAESETLDENDAAMKAHMNMGHRVKQNSDGTYTWFDDKNKIARKVDGKKQSSVKWTAKGKDESDPDDMDEEVKLQEGISSAQISRMKAEYSKIDRIDPSSDNYKKLISMLDKLGKPELQTLSDAGIKFVSGLAKNRVNRMGMKKEEIELKEEQHSVLYKMKKTDPKIAVAHYKSKDDAHKFLSSVKEKGGNGIVRSKTNEEAQLDEGRPSQRHPLEGHDYHKKSDAELIYIGKDAHKAAEAMKGHNTNAENKYRDQANDAATVRYFRQKNGMPDWYKKKYGHDVKKEEVVSEASRVVKRIKDLAKKKMMKKEEETPSKSNVEKGDQLTGKKEPIEVNPEMKS
jgi:hypothetical protein